MSLVEISNFMPRNPKKSLEELHKEFSIYCRSVTKLAETTIRGYEASFGLFMSLVPGASVDNLSVEVLTYFFHKLDTRERISGVNNIKKGIKKSTQRTYWSKLTVFFNWLVLTNKIQQNPLKSMRPPQVRYEGKKFLGKEELLKIFTAISTTIEWSNLFVKKRNIALFTVAFTCGLRKGELLGLRCMDLDLDRAQLTVRAETSKSKSNRVVPLNHNAVQCLRDYIAERNKRNYQVPELFASNNKDSKFTSDGLKHLVEHLVEKSNTKFHIHRFRHSFAINLISNGSDVSKVQQLMGHTDIRMTSTYLRCRPTDSMRADVDRISIDSMP